MKQLNVTFEDDEHEELTDLKDSSNSNNWRDFILELKDAYIKLKGGQE